MKKASLIFRTVAALVFAVATAPRSFAACTVPQWGIAPGSAYGITAAGEIAAGDFDGDRHADVFAWGFTTLHIVRGTGTGTIPSDGTYYMNDSGTEISSMAVADFDGDSRSDAVLADYGLGHLLFYKGGSDGILHAPVVTSPGLLPKTIAAGDFDGDGKLDLAVATWESASVTIFAGDGAGHFVSVSTATLSSPRVVKVAAGDIDGDGILDLAVAHEATSAIDVLFGQGNATFAAPVAVETGHYPVSIALKDVNADARLDLVALHSTDLAVTVNLAGAGRAIGPASTHSVANGSGYQDPKDVVVADFNGDGTVDIVASYAGLNEVAFLSGHGDGSFQDATFMVAGSPYNELMPSALAVADFDEDGAPDLVLFDRLNLRAALALNRCGFSAVTATPVYSIVSRFQPSTVTVNVKGVPGTPLVPTGTISVKQDLYILTTAPLVNGSATISVPGLAGPAGVQLVTVEYGGDDFFGPSSTTYKQKTTDPVTTVTIKLQSQQPTGMFYGNNLSALATASTLNMPTPTGVLTFVRDGTSASTSLKYSGQASVSLVGLAPGTHTVSALYGGDATHPPATATALTYQIFQGTPPFDFSNWRDTSTLGTAFSTSLYFGGTGYGSAPTGRVTVKIDGVQVASLGSGESYYFSKQLTYGLHFFEASYPGDGNWASKTITKMHRVLTAGSFSLNATRTASYTSLLTWTAYAGANHYKVVRWAVADGPSITSVFFYPSGTISCTDSLPSYGPFVYYVEACDAGGAVLARSNSDLTMYSYAPVVMPGQLITARSIYEVRSQIDRARSALGLSAWYWPNSLTGKTIRAADIQELRDVLNQTLARVGIPPVTYTAPQLIPGTTVIRATDIEEINQAMR